jgi:hypothetical protein
MLGGAALNFAPINPIKALKATQPRTEAASGPGTF